MSGRKRGGHRADDETVVDRIVDALERSPSGLHDLGDASINIPDEWPAALADVYFAFDGARLFNESIVLHPSAAIERDGQHWVVGDVGGDEIRVDKKGRVWRLDEETGDQVMDGSAFDRWLHGVIDAENLLFDGDGEFAELAFDDAGDVTAEVEQARLRAQMKRDTRAPGPRWRLARLLARQGDSERARVLLEEVVEQMPDFPWAWLDLARIGEQVGELDGAYDEAVMAAESAQKLGHDQAGYFWAQAARLAARRGAEAERAQAAARALAADPGLVRAQIAGAEQNLDDGDLASARGLAALARAVAPRDLTAADLARRIDIAVAEAAVARQEKEAEAGDEEDGDEDDDDLEGEDDDLEGEDDDDLEDDDEDDLEDEDVDEDLADDDDEDEPAAGDEDVTIIASVAPVVADADDSGDDDDDRLN
jgi:tetratricopeptide (TPR) repeat protein